MKSLFIALALVAASVVANADQLKSYNCRADDGGVITPDAITVQVNRNALVVSFPGLQVSERAQPSFERAAGRGNVRGGVYFVNKNPGSFFKEGSRINHTIMRAFVTHGLLRKDQTGELTMVYKRTAPRLKGTNESQWERDYDCVAR